MTPDPPYAAIKADDGHLECSRCGRRVQWWMGRLQHTKKANAIRCAVLRGELARPMACRDCGKPKLYEFVPDKFLHIDEEDAIACALQRQAATKHERIA